MVSLPDAEPVLEVEPLVEVLPELEELPPQAARPTAIEAARVNESAFFIVLSPLP